VKTTNGRTTRGLDAIFKSLPRLGSPEYIRYLCDATAKDLPPQVLVRAYRQLAEAGEHEAADRTLERLFGYEQKYGYLLVVRRLARLHLGRYDRANEFEDLVRETVKRMLMALPSSQGAFAERAWAKFSEQQFFQAWRDLYGRSGDKAEVEIAEPVKDAETGRVQNLADESEAEEAPWHTVFDRPDAVVDLLADRACYTTIVQEIDSWDDPELQAVAIDQFLEEPAAVSGSRMRSEKQSLTDRTGLDRDKINRLIKKARIRLKAALVREYLLGPEPPRVSSPSDTDTLKRRSR
jgi:hypothetical protein